MCVSDTCCGRFLICFFVLLISSCIWILLSGDYSRILMDSDAEPPLVLETNRLPLISSDRKIIYVASEEGLPIAHNFILRNPSIPIEKIVYRKPGLNSTLHIFPIQREGLMATNDNLSDFTWIGICTMSLSVAFALAIVYVYIFKDIWAMFKKQGYNAMDGCCDTLYDTSIDILDDPFDSPIDSPLGSPIKTKPKKGWKPSLLDLEDSDLDKPLLIA